MGDLRLTSRALWITSVVLCLMTTMYFAGHWVGQTYGGGMASENLNAEELSMLTKNEFLEVSRILNDPKTTNYPLPINYNHQPKYQGVQSETEKMPLIPPPTNTGDTNSKVYAEAISTKPPKTKDIFVDRWLRDLEFAKICQSDEKSEPLVLSVVVSAPSHFKERDAIRQGWGRTAAKGKA